MFRRSKILVCAAPAMVFVAGLAHALDPEDPVAEAAAPASAASTPSAVEQMLVERLDAGQLDRNYIALEHLGGRFLARYEPGRAQQAEGAIVIVPGFTRLVSNEALVDALIEEFPSNGWAVLAVQMPLLPAGSPLTAYADGYTGAAERLAQACARLAADGITRIVLVGLEGGAGYALRFLEDNSSGVEIVGFATRGHWAGEVAAPGTPMIEFVGAIDDRALAEARRRDETAQRENRPHRLVTISGVGREFTAADADVARRLRGWVITTVGEDTL